MPVSDFLSKAENYFFSDKADAIIRLTEGELAKVRRYEETFTVWHDDVSMSEPDVVKWMMNKYDIPRHQAYRETYEIRLLLGNVNIAAKEYQRHRANQMINKGFKLANDAKDKLDVARAEAMIRAGKALTDVNRLNKFEPEELPYDKIVPAAFEPSPDPELLKEGTLTVASATRRFKALDEKYNFFKDAEIIDETPEEYAGTTE